MVLPAEWSAHRGIIIAWPHAGTDWRDTEGILQLYVRLARLLSEYEELTIVAPEPEAVRDALRPGIPGNIRVIECPTDDTWTRDTLFITLTDGPHRRLLDFRFNGWGDKFAAGRDNDISRRVSRWFEGDYQSELDFVLEGGSIESDGRGTIFTTSHCLLAPHRNQPLTRAQIEARLLRSLAAERVVWIDHGHLIGDDTDGHIDMMVRLAPDDTLLYITPYDGPDAPAGDAAHADECADLRLMADELRSLRTVDGRPYRLLPLPAPRPVYYEGERLPASYANFLVVSGAVIYPTYGQPDRDTEAGRVIERAFPGRKAVGFDCQLLIRQHGSLHCSTMQYY